MGDVEYEPYPEQQPQVPAANPQSAPQAAWNRLAIISFVIPLALVALSSVLQPVVSMIDSNPDATANLSKLIVLGIVATVVELAATVVGLVLGHQSLRARYAHLRGRGFGVAGLILGYLTLAYTLVTVVGAILLVALIGSAFHG